MEKSAAQDMKSLLMKNGMTSGPAGRVVEILEPMGYFEVPASMTFHGAWPGGLFEHSWTVAQELVHMTKTLGLTWQMRRSPVLVGMFHDLCKTEEYEKDGDGWKHYKLKGHGERSVSMAEAILNDAAALRRRCRTDGAGRGGVCGQRRAVLCGERRAAAVRVPA